MECMQPGAIRDEDLFAYLAGEKVRAVVVQHLAACQRCSSRLADYRRMELMLTSKLYRWDCPSNQVLGEYHLGLLNNGLATAVKMHLSMCVLCAAEVATLQDFLANDPMLVEQPSAQHVTVVPSLLNHHRPVRGTDRLLDQLRERSAAGMRRIVAALQPAQPRLAFQREVAQKQSTTWPRRYTAEDINISLQVERDANQADALQLIGFVTRIGSSLEALQGIPVVLSSHAITLQAQQIDELGNFIFSSLVPATYTLEVQFPESTIVIEQVSVALQD